MVGAPFPPGCCTSTYILVGGERGGSAQPHLARTVLGVPPYMLVDFCSQCILGVLPNSVYGIALQLLGDLLAASGALSTPALPLSILQPLM